ncbi:MAG: SDR family NAD(P)-dependent oxidoreductase [Bacteriovoracia bacterium]
MLANKTVVVTGAGRGIGAATAKLFAQNRANVVIVSRTQRQLDEVCRQIQKQSPGVKVLTIVGDLSRQEFCKDIFERTKNEFGRIDVLVNNAAVFRGAPVEETSLSMWEEVIRVNVTSVFLMAKEAFYHMKDNGGCIVNISSLGGIRGTQKFKGFSAYTTSKAAVIGLTESLAVEGGPFGIQVNCIAPGAVDTQMLKEAAPHLRTSTKPEDIARIILFFSDKEQSGKCNGTIFEVLTNE